MGTFCLTDGLAELRDSLEQRTACEFVSLSYSSGGSKRGERNIDPATVLRDFEMAFLKKTLLAWRASLCGTRRSLHRLLLHRSLHDFSKL